MAFPTEPATMYKVTSLSEEKKEIRLLKLSCIEGADVNTTEPLRCEMMKASLLNPPSYKALSYTWGSPVFPKTLIVRLNSKIEAADSTQMELELPITESLHLALIHMRTAFLYPGTPGETIEEDGKKSILIWIDAVCINQQDEKEKSWQVNMMREVYASANSIAGWLGQPDVNLHIRDLFFAFFECARASSLRFGGRAAHPLTITHINHLTLIVDDDIVRWYRDYVFLKKEQKSMVTLDGKFVIGYDAVEWLRNRPFWSRAWILQEIYLGKHVSFYCGLDVIDSRLLNRMMFICAQAIELCGIEGLVGPLRFRHGIFNTTLSPLPLRWKYREEGESDLFDFLKAARSWGFAASDARDYIFALLGLVHETDRATIQADYSKTCAEVYTQVTKHFIASHGPEVLTWCRFPKAQTNLPSWVPDYSCMDFKSMGVSIWGTIEPNMASVNCTDEEWRLRSLSKLHASEIATLKHDSYLIDRITEVFPQIRPHRNTKSGNQRVSRIWEYQIRFNFLAHRIGSRARMYKEGKVHEAIAISSVCGGSDQGRNKLYPGASPMAQLLSCYNSLRMFSPRAEPAASTDRIRSIERHMIIAAIIRAGYTGHPSSDTLSESDSSELHFDYVWNGRSLHQNSTWGSPVSEFLDSAFGYMYDAFLPDLFRPPESFINKFEEMSGNGEHVHRRLCLTEKGYIGLVPKHAAQNDVVALIGKAHTPFVLRPVEQSLAGSSQSFRLVGESYVHGFMEWIIDRRSHMFHLQRNRSSLEAQTTIHLVPDGESVLIELI